MALARVVRLGFPRMQRVRAAALRWNLRLLDFIVVLGMFPVTVWLREQLGASWRWDLIADTEVLQEVNLGNQAFLTRLVLPAWLLALHSAGVYDLGRRVRSDVLLLRLARAGLVAIGLLLALVFVLHPSDTVSRSVVALYAVNVTLALWWTRLVAHRVVFGRQRDTLDILVVGGAVEAAGLVERLARNPDWGLRVVGGVVPDGENPSQLGGVPVLGKLSRLSDVLQRHNIGQVFMTGRAWDTAQLRFVANTCEEVGVTFSMDANFLNLSISEAQVQSFEDWTVLSFSTTPADAEALLIKRGIDVVGAVLALVVSAPVLALVALAIKLDDRGPVLYSQVRSGLYGRPFRMHKFRSMCVDADRRLGEVVQLNETGGPTFKAASDPRITRVGRFIRKTSLDEFPQFWNVLVGDMSLVGPRPPIPAEVAKYERWQMRRLSMKPGITCIWQVSGRSDIDFATWMKLDLQYIDQWSLFLDIKLLLRTLPAVLSARGAR